MNEEHTLTFRFDIDTHKCIREGVPKLLDLAEKQNVVFTFFLNTGRSISFIDSIKSILKKKDIQEEKEHIEMMSAMKKLGVRDYLYAAILNPNLSFYKVVIRRLNNSDSEMGIHGGKNHSLWHTYALEWNEEKIRSEIAFAIDRIRAICDDYEPIGFASPGWTSPKMLPKILKDYKFKYYADLRCKDKDEIMDMTECLPCVGVNLLGEPGGVAFFEHCRVKKYNDSDILDIIKTSIESNQHTILYDHPYYAGVNELDLIEKIIQLCKEKGVKIVRVVDLL